eukprot:IDg17083t1
MPEMDFRDFQKYKYVINMGSNQDWSERIRLLLFMNSAIIYHMAETQEFFTPLLKPWVHYIPANITLGDMAANVEWAIRHDEAVRKIVENQRAFADRYLTERAMEEYWDVALEEFAARQAMDDLHARAPPADNARATHFAAPPCPPSPVRMSQARRTRAHLCNVNTRARATRRATPRRQRSSRCGTADRAAANTEHAPPCRTA